MEYSFSQYDPPQSVDAPPSPPRRTQSSTQITLTSATPRRRITLTPQHVRTLIELCLDARDTYEDMPKLEWWTEITRRFQADTGLKYLNCQQRVGDEVKKRRRAKAQEDPDDDPGTTKAQRNLDQWIDSLDGLVANTQRPIAEKLAAKTKERDEIQRIQLQSVHSRGKRRRVEHETMQSSDDEDYEDLRDTTGRSVSGSGSQPNTPSSMEDSLLRLASRSQSRGSRIFRGARRAHTKLKNSNFDERFLSIAGDIAQSLKGSSQSSDMRELKERVTRLEQEVQDAKSMVRQLRSHIRSSPEDARDSSLETQEYN